MSALYVAARTIHYLSAIVLFGGLVFVLAVARNAWSDAHTTLSDARPRPRRTLLMVGFASIVLAVVSGAIWLVITAAQMTGIPLDRAMSGGTLSAVLSKTLFGRVWIVRAYLMVALTALLAAIAASDYKHRSPLMTMIGTVLAGTYLAALAWAGHAAAGEGTDKVVQLASDAIHLLAAGAWLGALPALAYFLRTAPSHADAARATQRFSTLGVVSVAALLLTGVMNTLYLVGSVPALVGTDYGHLLLVKIAFFIAMLALAATNRWRLTPRMVDHDVLAVRALWRNAVLETIAGVAVVTIVGLLGITVPGMHKAPVWPFDYTLSWAFSHHSPGVHLLLIAVLIGAFACAIVMASGLYRRRHGLISLGLAGTVAALGFAAGFLIVPAYPTTYVKSPLRYNVNAIASGAVLYAQSCSGCHGPAGRGDGPASASLPQKPPNLVAQATQHRAGELFWLIAHGKPDASMPAFSPQLGDSDIWSVIQFLRAQADAEDAVRLTPNVNILNAVIAAPDFTFELGEHGQESLQSQNGQFMTLLVLYSLPESMQRLKVLAAEHNMLAREGMRVLALPMTGAAASAELEGLEGGEWILPGATANVATAYRLFTRTGDGEAVPSHAEFMIDRQGLIRARWMGVGDRDDLHIAELRNQIEILKKESLSPRVVERHGH